VREIPETMSQTATGPGLRDLHQYIASAPAWKLKSEKVAVDDGLTAAAEAAKPGKKRKAA